MAVKLSREEQYGIMALVDLAYNLNGGPAQVRQIAKRQRIPQRFLEQIFAKLRQANVVVGKRGPRGGYSLAKDPSEVKLEEVMRALRPRLQEDTRTDAPALAELIDLFHQHNLSYAPVVDAEDHLGVSLREFHQFWIRRDGLGAGGDRQRGKRQAKEAGKGLLRSGKHRWAAPEPGRWRKIRGFDHADHPVRISCGADPRFVRSSPVGRWNSRRSNCGRTAIR